MDPRHLYFDERLSLTGCCVYCGVDSGSRDHCPSKVLLDEPFPLNLPVVGACVDCNNNFSLDEQYVACLIEAVICGSANPGHVSRENIKRILTDTPGLAARLKESKRLDESGNIVWDVDADRIRRVVLKLARGHIAYELSAPKFEEPDSVSFVPLILMSDQQRSVFESPGKGSLVGLPEINSRAFIRAVTSPGWVVVQPGRYRYLIEPDGAFVSLVMSEYLACHVAWYDD